MTIAIIIFLNSVILTMIGRETICAVKGEYANCCILNIIFGSMVIIPITMSVYGHLYNDKELLENSLMVFMSVLGISFIIVTNKLFKPPHDEELNSDYLP